MPKDGIGIYVFDSEYRLYLVEKLNSTFSEGGKKLLVPGTTTFKKPWNRCTRNQKDKIIRDILIKESPISREQLSNHRIAFCLLGSWIHNDDNQDYLFDNYVIVLREGFRHLPGKGIVKRANITGESFNILELPADSIAPLTMNYFKSVLFHASGYIQSPASDSEHEEFKKSLSNDHKKYFLYEKKPGGGYGDVYVTLDIATLLPRVVKIPRSNPSDDSWQERFLLEGKALLSLSHKRVLNIEEIFSINRVDNDRYYMVKEYIRGKDLEKCRNIEKNHIQVIIGEIVRILAEVHKLGICHRDLKPNNIMIDFLKGNEPKITLIDFGLVKSPQIDVGADQKLTREGDRPGNKFFQSLVTYNSYPKHNLLDDYYSVLLIFYWLFDNKSFYNDYFKLPPSEVVKEVEACKSKYEDPFLEENAVEGFCGKRKEVLCIAQFSEFHKIVRQAYKDIYEITGSDLKVKNENGLEEQLKDVEEKILKIFE